MSHSPGVHENAKTFMDHFVALNSLSRVIVGLCRRPPLVANSLIPAIISLQEFASYLSVCVPNI